MNQSNACFEINIVFQEQNNYSYNLCCKIWLLVSIEHPQKENIQQTDSALSE